MSLNDSIETKEHWRSEAFVARNERDAARAELVRLRAEMEAEHEACEEALAGLRSMVDRLRAVLAAQRARTGQP